MMKILIFATGGTIESVVDGGSINVFAARQCAVAEDYAATHPDVQFDIRKPLNILSESLSADDFNTLASALYMADFSSYDGVILTVGSDNLAYLSAFVGLLCADAEVPICLVAANKILSEPTTNGFANFACAVELIRQRQYGVFVPYRNADGIMYVHSATDIRQADLSNDFFSFHGTYGVFENGVLHEQNIYFTQRLPIRYENDHLSEISNNVLLLHSYPMQDYARIGTDGVKAVLHTLYHSATLDSDRFVPWMESHPGIPVFLASFRKRRKMYQTATDAIEAGAIPLYGIAPECAYIKLLLACSQDELSVREFMEA